MRKNKRLIRYYFSMIMILLSGAAAVYLGGCIVSVNCHNAMYPGQQVFFSAESEEDGIVITFMDKQYHLFS